MSQPAMLKKILKKGDQSNKQQEFLINLTGEVIINANDSGDLNKSSEE